MQELKWSKTEKVAARRAFDWAYRRECDAIAAKLKAFTATVKEPADIWRIHDFLTEQRRTIDEKYDYRYSVLISVLATLLKEGWLKEADLEGLREDKIEDIKSWASM
jgi:hypothetical protein